MSFIKFIIVDRSSSKEYIENISSNSNHGEKILILQTEKEIEDAITDLRSSKLLDLFSSAYGNFDDVELYKDNECLVNRPIDKDMTELMRKSTNNSTTGRVDNQYHTISILYDSFLKERDDYRIAQSIQSFKDFYMKINELEKNIFLNGEIGNGEFFKKYERKDRLLCEEKELKRKDRRPCGEKELKSMDEFKQIYERYDDLRKQNPDSSDRPLNDFLEIAIRPYKLMKYQGEIDDAENDTEDDAENDPKNELNCFLWLSAFSLIFSEISSEGRLNEGCNMLAFLAIYRSYEFLLNATYAFSSDKNTNERKNIHELIGDCLSHSKLASNLIFKKVFDADAKEKNPLNFQRLRNHRNTFFLTHGIRYVDRKTVQEYIQQCKELVCSLEKDALFGLDNHPESRPFNSKYDMLKAAHFYNLGDLLVEEILHSFSLQIQFTNFK